MIHAQTHTYIYIYKYIYIYIYIYIFITCFTYRDGGALGFHGSRNAFVFFTGTVRRKTLQRQVGHVVGTPDIYFIPRIFILYP